ncbi:methyl-accepting chemotaxis protein [Chitinilyticum piscinae]|uniref:Methyl-accepting chemotaxis protein n=1 Tax=Chitinilyticum piscinae TaxID=2866724 RepID=A0A8J7FVM9_9NEIS|nr:methyl-accepting chemotaxis protein [Chitinilyticum piscinae]MBE9607970.1 methyl-accepting chemotaxis protein [Chitinilyticum piscinae]
MKNWKLRTRLLAGFGAVLALLLVVGGVGFLSVAKVRTQLSELVDSTYPKVALANEIIQINLGNGQEIRNAPLADSLSDMDDVLARAETGHKQLQAKLAELKSLLTDPDAIALFASVEAKGKQLDQATTVLINQLKIDRSIAGKLINQDYAKASGEFQASLNALAQHLRSDMEEDRNSARTATTAALSLMLMLGAIAIVLGLSVAWVIASKVASQLRSAATVAGQIAEGDLTHDWSGQRYGQDEIGQLLGSLHKMQDKLTDMIRQISRNADNVAGTARQLSSVSQQLTGSSEEQSGAASAMAAAVQQVSTSMEQVADNTLEVEQQARSAGDLAEAGNGDVQAASHEMREIATEVTAVSERIAELGQNIRDIGSIVVVIRDVADQTNLLALNAAIEAARAGEQGRGFAVVADEVRKLAERTAQSASQITAMVNSIQQGAEQAVQRMDNGSRRASAGLDQANKASESIERINQRNHDVVAAVTVITEQMQEQRVATRDIAVNVERIAGMAQSTSQASRSMASSVHELERMSAELAAAMQRFRVR